MQAQLAIKVEQVQDQEHFLKKKKAESIYHGVKTSPTTTRILCSTMMKAATLIVLLVATVAAGSPYPYDWDSFPGQEQQPGMALPSSWEPEDEFALAEQNAGGNIGGGAGNIGGGTNVGGNIGGGSIQSGHSEEELLAQASCQGIAAALGLIYPAYAVGRDCKSSVTCYQICTSKHLHVQDPATASVTWAAIRGFHIYKRDQKTNPSGTPQTATLGLKSEMFANIHYKGCGPNYCCCVAHTGHIDQY